MTKIDIFSGFLGAGKTTLIKKLITEAYKGEKVVLIENEFGEIGIDGGFLKDAGIEITEMNSGCICCTLVGDFTEALKKVLAEYTPDRIVIEPSGVGKLSDVIRAVEKIDSKDTVLNAFTTVVDAKKCKVYLKNFGEFFIDQVENASAIVLSHTAGIDNEKLHNCIHLLREHNSNATIVSTDWNLLTGAQILEATEKKNTLEHHIHSLEHHHDHDEHCDCGCHDHEHHHDHDEHCDCGCHDHEHHHDHDEHCDCGCHDHEHHHDHDEHCDCGCHDHEHHHHADEVFSSFGRETAKKFTAEFIKEALSELENQEKYGIILRAKGIVEGENGEWIHFDYIPGEPDVRLGRAEIIGRLCVIGSKINEQAIAELFGV
ncbi:MAG: cobalamin biosynthesis protein CobW [Ruminococcaceae bacterium]|nr:cobalamin biosynthesis protein CobW [Oscillospiraceae bacterium]